MPLLVPLLVVFVVAGLAAAVVASSDASAKFKAVRPGEAVLNAAKKISVIDANIIGVSTGDGPGNPYGTAVEPISQADGWRPVWVEKAENAWLEWGACYNDWQQDIQEHYANSTESQVDDFMAKRLAKFWGYLFETIPVISWLVARVCFRLWLPATKLKVDGEWYFVPQSPRQGPFTEAERVEGGWWLPGWQPGTSRIGFATSYPQWPLAWPPPAGVVTGGWVRNLGDLTGTGFDTYQLISFQDGSERSFPMMSERGWRAVLGFSDYNFGGHVNGDPISMFSAWRGDGADDVVKKAASRTRATNRYQRPS